MYTSMTSQSKAVSTNQLHTVLQLGRSVVISQEWVIQVLKCQYQYFMYLILRHQVIFRKNQNFDFWHHMIIDCKKKHTYIHNLRFPKNIDLNHKSIHHSEFLTYAVVIDIVSATLYHTQYFDTRLNRARRYRNF